MKHENWQIGNYSSCDILLGSRLHNFERIKSATASKAFA